MEKVHTGLINTKRVFADFKRKLRTQCAPLVWSKVKRALETVRLGERDDIVMLSHGEQGVTEMVVCTYREVLGSSPKLRVAPLFAMRFLKDRPDGEVDIWHEVTLEISSRALELRSVAGASEAKSLEVTVGGLSHLRDDVISSLKSDFRLSPGIPVVLDGQVIEGAPMEAADSSDELIEEEQSPGLFIDPMVGALFGWENADFDLFQELRGRLSFADPAAWKSGDEGESLQYRAGGYRLEAVDDVDEFREAVLAAGLLPIVLMGVMPLLSQAPRSKGTVIACYDGSGRLMEFVLLMRTASASGREGATCHVGMIYKVVHINVGVAGYSGHALIRNAVRKQAAEDVAAFAASLQASCESVVVDVGALNMSLDEGLSLEVLNSIKAGAEDAAASLPSAVRIGQVKATRLDEEAYVRIVNAVNRNREALSRDWT